MQITKINMIALKRTAVKCIIGSTLEATVSSEFSFPI